MIIQDLEQRTPEWMAMRVGCCTGSRVEEVTRRLKVNSKGRLKGDYAKCRQDYLMEVVIERLTGRTADHGIGGLAAVEWGIEQEPFARAAYELTTDLEVNPIGLAMHPRIEWFAASPDSLVGSDGLLEIKCLASHNHLDILTAGEIPEEYLPQMLAEMACAERQWCDFVAFDPRFPKNLQLFIRRLHRDEELVKQMEAEIELFLGDVLLKLGELASYASKNEIGAEIEQERTGGVL